MDNGVGTQNTKKNGSAMSGKAAEQAPIHVGLDGPFSRAIPRRVSNVPAHWS